MTIERNLRDAARMCQATYTITAQCEDMARARAWLWASDLGQPETRMQAWVTMRDIVEQSREEWTR